MFFLATILISFTSAFVGPWSGNKVLPATRPYMIGAVLHRPTVASHEVGACDEKSDATMPSSTTELNEIISSLGQQKQFSSMLRLLDASRESSISPPDAVTFSKVITFLALSSRGGLRQAEEILREVETIRPDRESYESMIRGWSMWHGNEPGTYERCCELLEDLWDYQEEQQKLLGQERHDMTLSSGGGDVDHVAEYHGPTRSTYLCVLQVLMRSDDGRKGASIGEEAQRLLDEMNEKSEQYPFLKPNIVCVNVVL